MSIRQPLTLFKRLAINCCCFHLKGLPSRRVAVWAFISILVTISLVTITMATVSEACSFCILKCWAAAEWKEEGKKKKHNLTLTLHDCSYLIATVSWLDTRMKKLHSPARKLLDWVLTFEQMAACCQHNWALRGNFLSGIERKITFYIGHVKSFVKFPTIFGVTRGSDRGKKNVLFGL